MDGIEIAVRWTPGATSRAEEFATGRDLLRQTAAAVLASAASTVVISAVCPDCGGEHGQPTTSGAFLSLTRAPGVTIAVASAAGPVGVDVELRDGSPDRERAILQLTGVGSLQHWTRVEAVLKADGRGLRVDPSLVLVEGDLATVADTDVTYRLHTPSVHESLVVTIATAVS